MSQFISLQSKERIRITFLILGLAALVLGSFWLLKMMQNSSDDNTALTSGKPDYYIHDFRYVRMNEDGTPHYDITGVTTVHDPKTDQVEVSSPKLTTFDQKQGIATLVAKRAVITNHHEQIHLYNDVNLDRPASAGNEHLHVATSYALVLPKDDIVKTDKPVQITLGSSVMNSVGMIVNNKTHQLSLLHSVRGSYIDSATSRNQN